MSIVTPINALAAKGSYHMDPAHSRVGFWVRHAMVTKVRGEFLDYDVWINYQPLDPAKTSVKAVIKAVSFNTNNSERDNHVRSSDFLDVEKYPNIVFESTAWQVDVAEDGTVAADAVISGNLTINGITRPIDLNVEFSGMVKDMEGDTRIGFAAKAELLRSDFGLTYNVPMKAGGLVLADCVHIEIEGAAIRNE